MYYIGKRLRIGIGRGYSKPFSIYFKEYGLYGIDITLFGINFWLLFLGT